ncbi:protein translocase subunit SecD [Conexibacter sp. JD483]|uniref:protein translocase subunit SecD n=1 Tax=unclassified Conexibacter TaxID=2627773 RepID=UPI002716F357|nr:MULTISPECIES: protein translocase subunit SecD [unclassified Conexibacter]MDO8185145.1 protein translocase subunit SecD [Conexibacter sp. CPCC 205706]MDO8196855.1 protein translocase subunit SecD [Conexibacter sp. CPCC 205762]MDR9368631.1 protein translocase subunit SecD [Conexibacter sp. JD483]
MNPRRRTGLILLLVLGLLCASGIVIATKDTKLGLDLEGGVELVYQGEPTPQVPRVTASDVDRAVEIIRKRVDQLGVAEPEIQRAGSNQISVGLPAVNDIERAKNQVGTPAQLFFYDWEANVLTPDGRFVAPLLTSQDQTATAISQNGGSSSRGQPLYEAVKLASRQDPSTDVRAGSRSGSAYYLFDRDHRYLAGPEKSEADLIAALPNRATSLPAGSEVLTVPQGWVVLQSTTTRSGAAPTEADDPLARFYVLRDSVALSGSDIKDPQQGFNQSQQPDVEFRFTNRGKNAFQRVTREISQRGQSLALPGTSPALVAQHFAVALDGKLISVASIDPNRLPDGIDGENGAIIEGGFTIQSAQDLADLLKLGALPIGLELISQSQVSATLGKQALHEGLVAGIVGLILVAGFLITFYRILGVIATVALLIYGVYFYALIKLVPITMTLPGIAGVILTIGVAADANIVIFERVKEEVRAGRSVPAAISTGYRKGLTAIIDANVVTVMVAFIIFILATAGVKGFAFTLGVGTLVSLFTAVLATQAILTTMGRTRLLGRPSALGASGEGHRWKTDFMGLSRWFFSLSGVILLICALAIGAKGLNFGIDFTSGTRITTALSQPASEGDLRASLAAVGASDAKIQRVTNRELGDNVVQISTEELKPQDVERVRAELTRDFGGVQNFTASSVGPTFGKTVANNAIVAIIASLLVISAYIALRFQWRFAVPVLIAVAHDVLIVSGIYALTGREVTASTVAALLTVLGYSLYDTIIVFDRIRENMPRMPRAAFSQIVNRSMSEVLTRSLVTSLSTAIPILALMIFGGDTLRDFAFALLVGVLSGAYSSVFIAGPVLWHWKEREQVYTTRRRRIKAENGGVVPPYALATAGAPIDVEPERKTRRRGRLTSPDDPERAVSADEFEQMKRDLDVDNSAAAVTRPPRRTRSATATPEPPAATPEPAEPEEPANYPDGRAPDEPENDGMVKQPRRSAARRRHGRPR